MRVITPSSEHLSNAIRIGLANNQQKLQQTMMKKIQKLNGLVGRCRWCVRAAVCVRGKQIGYWCYFSLFEKH